MTGAVLAGTLFYSAAETQPLPRNPPPDERQTTNTVKFSKTTIQIGLRYENWNDRGIIDEFRALFPFAQRGGGFGLNLPPDDPRVKQLLDEFARRGIPRADYITDPPKLPRPRFEYMLEYHHHYEPADFDSAHYLFLKHEVLVGSDQQRDTQGRLMLSVTKLPADFKIGCVLWEAIVVSDSVRRELIESGMVGLRFVEVVTMEQSTRAKLWELQSSVILPPMPRDRVQRHRVSPDDDVHVSGILDGEYREKEIHYPEDALRKIEPFDVAQTYEIFGGPVRREAGSVGGERRTIVSQRFRQFCVSRQLKVSWHSPVRIDGVPQERR